MYSIIIWNAFLLLFGMLIFWFLYHKSGSVSEKDPFAYMCRNLLGVGNHFLGVRLRVSQLTGRLHQRVGDVTMDTASRGPVVIVRSMEN